MKKETPPRPAFVRQEFYTLEEFGAALDVSRATIYRRVKDGVIRSNKIGNVRRIPHAEFARLAGEAS